MAVLTAEAAAAKRVLQVELIAARKEVRRIWMQRSTARRKALDARIRKLEMALLAIDPDAVLYRGMAGLWR